MMWSRIFDTVEQASEESKIEPAPKRMKTNNMEEPSGSISQLMNKQIFSMPSTSANDGGVIMNISSKSSKNGKNLNIKKINVIIIVVIML